MLKQMFRMLSVNCMIKGAMPKAMQGRMTEPRRRAYRSCSRSVVVFPVRKRRIQAQEIPWERMVARAAPCTPIPRAKMKIGSRIMLQAAPMVTVSIPVLAKPWALMKALRPRASWTNRVPREYIFM